MIDKKNQKTCEFGTEAVEYMYGEMPAARLVSFESHLAECSFCIEEFASVSEARFEVYEWRKLEFAPLQTPEILIPFSAADRAVSSPEELPWYRKLSEVVSFSPRFAGAAAGFAVLVTVAGFAFVAFTGGADSRDVAADDLNVPVAVSSKVESSGVDRNAVSAPAPVEKSPEPKIAERERTVERPAVVPVRISTRGTPKAKVSSPAEKPIQAVKSATDRQNIQKLPRLNDFEDESDDSLRLAQLFEDIETFD